MFVLPFKKICLQAMQTLCVKLPFNKSRQSFEEKNVTTYESQSHQDVQFNNNSFQVTSANVVMPSVPNRLVTKLYLNAITERTT